MYICACIIRALSAVSIGDVTPTISTFRIRRGIRRSHQLSWMRAREARREACREEVERQQRRRQAGSSCDYPKVMHGSFSLPQFMPKTFPTLTNAHKTRSKRCKIA